MRTTSKNILFFVRSLFLLSLALFFSLPEFFGDFAQAGKKPTLSKESQQLSRSSGGNSASEEETPQPAAPWSEWEPLSPNVNVPEADYSVPTLGPTTILDPLDQYKISSKDDSATIVLKVDDMISGLAPAVVRAVSGDITHGRSPQILMDTADEIAADTKDIYSDIFSMYVATDAMKAQLSRNYGAFNEAGQSQDAAQELNAKSDAMAERAAGMNHALKGMLQQAQAGRELVKEMPDMFSEMEKDGQEAVKYFDRFAGQVNGAANLFEGAARDLKGRGLEAGKTFGDTRRYLTELKQFSNENKSHITSQLDYVRQSKAYVQNTDKFIGNTVRDIETASRDIQGMEDYFRSAKVGPAAGKDIMAAGEEGSVCDGAEKEDLKELQDCAKDCRTVCRFKEKVGDTYCYECPSGSPDSCYDVKAWPDNHPWCQPGGVCHSDPTLYCSPFGTIGPNLEKLSCTNCKKRPDECWQKVGDGTMFYSTCLQSCWDGECVYKGKYQEAEWDGTPEFLHCYKCEGPPGPPACEDLNWGTTLYSDCKASCPDPGDCEKVTMSVPGKPAPAPGQEGEDGEDDGEDGGGQEGEGTGGTQAGGTPPQGGARTGNPPEGTPGQPGGGGAAATAGGAPSAPGAGGQPTGGETPTDQQPPPAPTTSQPNPPQSPTTTDQPEPPGNPPKPPDNPQTSFYRSWLDETKERAKSREDIIADPNEGEYTKDEAQRQLETMTREKKYLEGRIQEIEQGDLDRQKQIDEENKRKEQYERTRPRPRDYGAEMRRADFEYKANKLKEATDALNTKLREARDILGARQERIEKIDKEIEQIQGQSTQTRESQKRLQDLIDMRNQFQKKLDELKRQYREEIEKLRVEYQRRLWAVDERSRRRAEATRIDEYFDKLTELRDREQTNAIRNETFETIIRGLEEELKTAEANGDDDRADELRSQIENVKRGFTEWKEQTDRQIKTLKDQLWELEYRNSYEGAGPTSPESLSRLLDQYRTSIQNDISTAEKTIADLERVGSRTAEQERVLQVLKDRVSTLRSAVDDLQAKKDAVTNGTRFSDEDRQRVVNSATMVANGMMNRGADKSMARLFAESLGEEYVHNLNPLVMGKKTVAFTIGMAQGVGSAVAGLAELGWEALDTIGESIAVDLGFEEGGIFGTENLDTINNALAGISSANFDSVINLVVAGGKMIDDTLKELERSGDIDWATARLGGRIAGEVVVGDAVIAGAIGKLGTVARGADAASDVGRVAGKVDDFVDAGRAGSKIDDAARTQRFPDFEAPGTSVVDDAGDLGKTQQYPDFETPGSAVVDDAADVGTGVTKADDAPGSTPRDAPANRGPPETPGTTPRAGIGPNAQATVTGPDGNPITIKTGDELGHGSTSTVFADATNPKKAIRITEPGKGGITEAPALDRAGRQAVESIQRPGGPIRITEKGEPFMVTDPNSPLKGKIVEVVERVDNGSADNFLKKQPGGTMTQGQAQAFADATKELNKNGFAWMDNHTGNYGFEEIPGTQDGWRVVVLDPGGIVPMKGATTAEKAANATALQNRLNNMDSQLADMVNSASPGFKKNMAMMERGAIFEEFGGTIDAAGMGLKSPHDIAFYPFGTSEFPQVRSLFQ